MFMLGRRNNNAKSVTGVRSLDAEPNRSRRNALISPPLFSTYYCAGILETVFHNSKNDQKIEKKVAAMLNVVIA